MTVADLTGQRILVTGVTGQVAGPVARSLAAGNAVFGAARFSNPNARQPLEDAGVHTITIDLETPDLAEIPGDLDYALHFAVMRVNDFDRDLAANAEAVAFLIERVAGVKAFLHCSSTAVYEPLDHEPRVETDLLGDSHRPFGFMPTYSIVKIAAESSAKYAARRFGVPTVIARLAVPYSDSSGWMAFHLAMMIGGHAVPVHVKAPSQYSPIHHDDIMASLPFLLGAAAVPATTFNWASGEVVSIEDWCEEFGRLTGIGPRFVTTTAGTIESIIPDTTKLHALGFKPSVPWRDGMRRLVATTHPELLRA